MKTLFVSIATQKGGVGKTALSVLLASNLHYRQGFNIAIMDCDYPQHSIAEQRSRDIDLVSHNPYYRQLASRQFSQLNKKAYPVIESQALDVMDKAQALLSENQDAIDILFFDMPGTLNTPGVVNVLSQMDYIFCPITADRLVLESSLGFANTIKDQIITQNKGNIKELFLFWNMVDGREKSELYEIYENVIKELNLSLLNTFIPDTKKFRRELSGTVKPIFRSTLLPAEKYLLKESNLEDLTHEIITHLKLSHVKK